MEFSMGNGDSKKARKTRGAKLPADLDAEFEEMMQAVNPKAKQSDYLIEAVRLYLMAYKRCGCNLRTLKPHCEIKCIPAVASIDEKTKQIRHSK